MSDARSAQCEASLDAGDKFELVTTPYSACLALKDTEL
jgi:hypothetical protein